MMCSDADHRAPRSALIVWPAAALLWISSPTGLAAASGALDPSFGAAGRVITDLGSFSDSGDDVAIDPSGRIVVLGATDSDLALVRYTVEGSIDTGFGIGGLVTTDFASSPDFAGSVTIDASGRILAVGYSTDNGGTGVDFILARYLSDGSLDASFGIDGRVITDFASRLDLGFSLAIDTAGRIIAAGWTQQSSSSSDFDFGLVRYHSDGSLDSSFGPSLTGKVATDFGSQPDFLYNIAIDADDSIVAVGATYPGGNVSRSDFAVARYDSGGLLDSAFGASGKVTMDFASGTDLARDVMFDDHGRIVVVGDSNQGGSSGWDFALARLAADGSLDAGFGTGGKVTTSFGDFGVFVDGNLSELCWRGTIDAGGRILVAGHAYQGSTGFDFAVARFDDNGSLDDGFGAGGKVVTDFGATPDFGRGLAIDTAGRIVIAGSSDQAGSTGDDLAVARHRVVAREVIEAIIERVEDLEGSGVLSSGQANSLIAKLRGALKKLDKGNTKAAIHSLRVFIHQVRALITAGALPAAAGQPLIDAAEVAIDQLP